MATPIKLISTDYDGTIFSEFGNPPIPAELEELIGSLQRQGAKWVINTGRDMSSLMESLGRKHITIEPDYLVLVEREIYQHDGSSYLGLDDWNAACAHDHGHLFARIERDVPKLTEWINARFHARIYSDPYSPFCLIAGNNHDADIIHRHLDEYAATVENLVVVRNDVYARFSHVAYNKGSALAEIMRRLSVSPPEVFAVGDWLNDLPMLDRRHAHHIAAPANAIEPVKAAVLSGGGFVSQFSHGNGVVEALRLALQKTV